VSNERRAQPRVTKRFEGSWKGASGGGQCVIADLSQTGCYVQTLAAPRAGDDTRVTIQFGAHSCTCRGRVVYVEAGMGFAVKFLDLSDTEAAVLRDLIDALLAPAPA
jgi:hypothetical protein